MMKTSAYSFDGLADVLKRPDGRGTSRSPAVVASVFQTGLNLIRDLEQRGVRAIGVDCNPENPGFRSKYGRSFLCPNPDKQPAEWLEFMISLAEAIGEKAVLIAASDIFVAAIGRNAATLRNYFIFSESGAVLQSRLGSKETQYALARQHGFPAPQSVHVRSRQDLEEFCRIAKFPVLIKPLAQREWLALPEGHAFRYRKTVSAQTPEELKANYESVAELVPEAVAQEEIVGPDSAKYCYLSVYSKSGERLGACVVRELRAYPVLYGCATLVQPVVDEEIDRVCNEFLLKIGYKGLCEIELKRDVRDGRLGLIEVNPRFSGTGDAAKYTGVETGYMHYLDLIGEAQAPVEPTNFNFRHFMLASDMAAFPKYLVLGQLGWMEWLRSYRGAVKYFDFDRKDPKVAWSTAKKSARGILGGLWHNLRDR